MTDAPDRPDPAAIELPGGPKAREPIPRDPIEGIDLPTFVKISAEIAEGSPPRAAILRAVGIDEARWTFVEQGWLLRAAVAAIRGDREMVDEINREFVEAQDALGPTEPTHSLDRYALIVARIEAGAPAPAVLREQGLTLSGYARLVRAWTRRIASDPALGATFREWVEAAKRRP